MLRVTILWSQNHISGFEARGHSGFAEAGKDIVCAAASAIAQTAVLGLKEYLGSNVGFSAADGEMYCTVNSALAPDKRKAADIILDTMRLGFLEIQKVYPEFLQIVEREV